MNKNLCDFFAISEKRPNTGNISSSFDNIGSNEYLSIYSVNHFKRVNLAIKLEDKTSGDIYVENLYAIYVPLDISSNGLIKFLESNYFNKNWYTIINVYEITKLV